MTERRPEEMRKREVPCGSWKQVATEKSKESVRIMTSGREERSTCFLSLNHFVTGYYFYDAPSSIYMQCGEEAFEALDISSGGG